MGCLGKFVYEDKLPYVAENKVCSLENKHLEFISRNDMKRKEFSFKLDRKRNKMVVVLPTHSFADLYGTI